MSFEELLAQILEVLQREGRVSYRALRRRFNLTDDNLADLQDEIIAAKQLARDEDGKVLVWTGGPLAPPTSTQTPPDTVRRQISPLASAATAPHEPEPPLHLSPERQKHKTQEALMAWLRAEAERQPVLAVWEDLHWADPSTLEWLGLFLEQAPTVPLLTLLTCRPEFSPPWAPRAALTHLTLTRLTRPQVEEMVRRVTGGKVLPIEVVQQIVARTDGVPLFVEEITKTVLEADWLQEGEDGYELTGPLPPLAIPATLQDALMARLDRLAEGKAVAQLGATLGRTFAHALLQAVAPLDELTVWRGLVELVQAEVLYQRGIPPHATYTFKHALLQEAAYQSLLRSTRQQYHQRIAQALEGQFPETVETEPELLAHHYTEAGRTAQAIAFWQRAGQQALQRSANLEAVRHLSTAIELHATLPETPARAQLELELQLALGPALIATKGQASPEVEQTYTRARELCQQMGETPQFFPTLRGLCRFYRNRGALQTARELGEQLHSLAQSRQEPALLLEAHDVLGDILFYPGEFAAARMHLEQGIALTDPTRALILFYDIAPGVTCLAFIPHAVVPGLSHAGRATGSGSAGPGPGTRPSPQSGLRTARCDLSASPPP